MQYKTDKHLTFYSVLLIKYISYKFVCLCTSSVARCAGQDNCTYTHQKHQQPMIFLFKLFFPIISQLIFIYLYL